jgi:hypothetical protein
MSKEAVVRQFFLDFIENLGSEYEDENNQEHIEEEANLILTDLFFSGLLKIEWNPRKHALRLNFRERKNKESKRQKRAL